MTKGSMTTDYASSMIQFEMRIGYTRKEEDDSKTAQKQQETL